MPLTDTYQPDAALKTDVTPQLGRHAKNTTSTPERALSQPSSECETTSTISEFQPTSKPKYAEDINRACILKEKCEKQAHRLAKIHHHINLLEEKV